MTQTKHTPEFDFNCELEFSPSEVGGTGVWTYNSLSWDHQSPADILIRHPDSRYKQDNGYTDALTQEVIKRWNSHACLLEALKGILELKEFQAIAAPFDSQVYNATHAAALALLKAEGQS